MGGIVSEGCLVVLYPLCKHRLSFPTWNYLTEQNQSRLQSPLAISAQVKEMKAAGKKIIAFGAGEPDFDTPGKISQAAIDALLSGNDALHAIFGNARSSRSDRKQITHRK